MSERKKIYKEISSYWDNPSRVLEILSRWGKGRKIPELRRVLEQQSKARRKREINGVEHKTEYFEMDFTGTGIKDHYDCGGGRKISRKKIY